MYNSIQDTSIIGKKVVFLPSCHSTNDIAAEIVQAGLFTEGTVVITDNQVGGRGQRGTSWQANPGENLTFSIVLCPGFLPVSEQFLLSQAVSISLATYFSAYCADVSIKWPNDIFIGKKKAAGILIENSIKGSEISYSIVGIGMNINQKTFDNTYATSLSLESSRELNLTDEFASVLRGIDAIYSRLKSGSENEAIRSQYLSLLYGFGLVRKFVIADQVHAGEVCGVTPQGMIRIRQPETGRIAEYGLKEISWVRD